MSRKIDNILLIDDDEPTNFLTNLMIQESGIGCDVHTMYTALDALEWLKVESNPTPDLILLDINMPMMNGWEFLEEYRQLPITTKSKMIIVMLTSSLNPHDKLKAEAIDEVSAYVNKPIAFDDILGIVDRVSA